MRNFVIALTFSGIVLGCSSVQKTTLPPETELLPPEMAHWPINNRFHGDKDFSSVDLFLSRIAKENPSAATTWWADYRRAQLWSKRDKNISCENYARLAQDPLFPLRNLASLRAHSVCPKNNQILARLDTFQVEKFDPWLNDVALDVAIQKAKSNNNRAALVELCLKKSKQNLRKEEKISWTEQALSYAKKLGDKKVIRDLENRLYGLSPRLIPEPTPKQFLDVAADHRYHRDFEKARQYYQKIISHPKLSISDKLQSLRGTRSTYKIEQRREEAVKATENIANFVTQYYKKSKKNAADAKLYTDTLLNLAKTYWTENDNKKALSTLEHLTKEVNGKATLAEVYWMRGRMEEETQNFAGAVDWFQKALNEPIETASFRDKLTWYLAWNERKLKNYDTALNHLQGLAERSENNFEKSRLQFWIAKIYKEKNDPSEAKSRFEDLIKEDPFSFYGLISHYELDLAFPARKMAKLDQAKDLSQIRLTRRLQEWVDRPYLEWLVAVREDEIAKNYLDTLAQRLRQESRDDLDSWTTLLQLYARSNNFLAMFSQLNLVDTAVRRTLLEENPNLIFPNPYFEVVNDAAGRFGISVEFVYSIMRQESSFNPQARSQMDAFGLMQLLPEVAKRSAQANALDYNQAEDLYEPHINIPIGSAHLRELWDRYNGELILAVASYNASETAILNWLKTRYRGDTLEFIEDIPYDETRDYVKLVMRNLITYQILNAKEETLRFPEWTLKISQQVQ